MFSPTNLTPNKGVGMLTPPNGDGRAVKTFDHNINGGGNNNGRNEGDIVSDTFKRGSFSTFN